MIKKKKNRGQFIISIALLIAVIAMTLALSVYFASMLHQRFRYKSFKEIVNTIDSDFKRALTNALSKATHDYIGVKPGGEIDLEHVTYNYTLLRLSAQNFMDQWKQTVINSYSSTGLEIDLKYKNMLLLEEREENYSDAGIDIPERWLYNLTTAYWFYPKSISAIRANLSLNITRIGFYGFKTSGLIYLILGIDVKDLREQLKSGKQINHVNVVVLKEGMTPVHDLTTKNFIVRVFDLYTGSWRKVPILGVSYLGDGNYIIYLPQEQKKEQSPPPSPSPGKEVTVVTTVTKTTTVTTSTAIATVTTTVKTITATTTKVTTTTLPETTTTRTRIKTTSITPTLPTTTVTVYSYVTSTSTITRKVKSFITETRKVYTITRTKYETVYTSTTSSTTTRFIVTSTTTTTTTTTTKITNTVTKYTTTTIIVVPKKPIQEPATTVTTTITSYVTETTTVSYTLTQYKTTTTYITTTSTKTIYSTTKTITKTITRTRYPTTQYETTTTITNTRVVTVRTTTTKTITTTKKIIAITITTTTKTISSISTTTITLTSFSITTTTTTKTIIENIYTTTTITVTEYVPPYEYSIWFQILVKDNRGIIVEAESYKDIDFMVERMTPSLTGSYRKQIIIKASSEDIPSGYTVSLTFDHASLVSSSKSLPSGNDIRIFYNDNGVLKEIDRVLDEESSWNSPSTKICFKTQAPIPANSADGNYYLYYGYINDSNPLADKSKVYDFYTDFYNIDNWGLWKEGNSPKVNVSSGIVKIDSLDGKKAGIYHKTYNISGGSIGYLLKVKSRHIEGIEGYLHTVWIYFDANETNGKIIQGYTYSTRGAKGNEPDHRIIRMADQTEYVITEVKGNDPKKDEWYIYEFYVTKDNKFKGLRNGEQMIPSSGWSMDGNYASGKIAIGVEGAAIAEWDWLIVRKYLENEPTITLKNEENVTGIKYPGYEVYNVEVIYSAENGTQWFWHGHNLKIIPLERKPIPPLPIRFIRVNVTRNGYSDNETDLIETISQVEEWSKDLTKPLYVYQKGETSARFGNSSKLVFNIVFPWGVKNQKVRIWWKDYLEAPPPTYGIKLSIQEEFVIIDNGKYKLQLLVIGGYSYYIDWSISIHYKDYHAEFALYGYEIYQLPGGGLWYPMKIPAGDWDWPIVYGPVRAIAHRYTNIVHDYPNNRTINDELLHEMYIIVPYNVSYFLWIMNGTWQKDISVNYLTAIMMISGNSTDENSLLRLNNWAYQESSYEDMKSSGNIKTSPPTFNDISNDISLSIEAKNYKYWSAQYRNGFGAAIILSGDTLNLLNSYNNHMLHIFTSEDYSRRVIDYSLEDSYSSRILINKGTQHKIYAAIWVYDGGYLVPEIWGSMFIEDYYPRVWALEEG